MTAIYAKRYAVFVPGKGPGEWVIPHDNACSSLCAPNESCSVTGSGACLGKAYEQAVPMLINSARALAAADFGAAGWTPETEHAAAQMRAALQMID